MIFSLFFAFSEHATEKIEILRWPKIFFYMLEHCPKSSEHAKFVDVKMFDQIGFPNTLSKGGGVRTRGRPPNSTFFPDCPQCEGDLEK